MTSTNGPPAPGATTRRSLLAALVGVAAGGSGCLQRARGVVNRSGPEPISLSIRTVPTDADPRSILIARFLSKKLKRVGVSARVIPTSEETLLRDVLVNQNFDLYVARHPENNDPDFLRPLLHSKFSSEPGWQNPFGYANLAVDDLLEKQRRQGGRARIETLRAIQRTVVAECPFVVVAFPDEIRAVRDDRIDGWTAHPLHTPQSYLSLRRRPDGSEWDSEDGNETTTAGTGATDASGGRSLTMAITDARPTKNLNPLSVEFRNGGAMTGLLYDPLARFIDGHVRPWLAESWQFSEGLGGQGPVAEVVLREGTTWHDGRPITADDVAFTYKFLDDTSLGNMQIPVPAPRFRGWSSLVSDVEVVDDRTVRVQFRPSHPETAALAFSVPVLPEHVWESKATEATVANLGEGSVTEALVWGNMTPVGSGPFRYESSTVNERLVFSPFEDHFVEGWDLEPPLSQFSGGFSFDRLTFLVVPSGDAAIELLLSGQADGTATGVMPSDVPRVGYSDAARLDVERSTGFYHVGFNVRSAPLSNTRFRRAVARLLDKEFLVREVLENYAAPAASPLAPYDAVAPALVWDGEDPELPFPGEAGEIDVERAREAFIEAGYRYREEAGVLVS